VGPLDIVHDQSDAIGFEVSGAEGLFLEGTEQGYDKFVVDPGMEGLMGLG